MAVQELLFLLIMTSSLVSSCPVRECSCAVGRRGVSIDCENRNFDKVPEFESGDEEYYELKLSGNYISVIPGKAFKKLNVERIDLSGNPIRKISTLAFEGLETRLKDLVIEAKSETPIKFPAQLLHPLQALEGAKIKGFDMPVLEHGLFLQSKNLQRLTLENCKIITVFPTALQGLDDKLELLDLSNNQLTSVPIAELKPLIHLRKLVLAQNRITTIQANSFQNMTNLIDLDLSQNSIQRIESAAFSGLEQGLEYLGLHANMISKSSLLAVANLAKLEQLNLAYNLFINTLPDYTFKNLNNLAYLNLQGNRLSAISPATFEGLGKSLSVLILSENKLTSLPDEGFRHLETLKWLYLDLMKLGGSFTQHTFHGLENTLEYLTLEGVEFMNDDLKSVHYLTALKSLNLCQNHVTKIPDGTFTSLTKLEQLMICHNNIENITQNCLSGTEENLQVLNLEGNAIETIDECPLKHFKALNQLNLDGNPLNCDCRLKWLRNWIDERDDITKMMIGWQCARPIRHMDRLLKHVGVQDLTCEDYQPKPCQEYVKPTAPVDMPHAHIDSAEVDGESVSLKWNIDKTESVVGVRLFYKMTENETYSYTLLLNPALRNYIIHDLFSETNYTICIGLDLKLGQSLPDEECITVATKTEDAAIPLSDTDKPSNLYVLIGSGVGGLVFILLLVVVTFQIYKWRRSVRLSKHGMYDTPWVTTRPQAPSLSTLPSRRSDFENPMRHYYSRPLSCGTIHTVSSHLPRSNSAAMSLDQEYGKTREEREYQGSMYKRAQSMDLRHYDMDRCLYKIDGLMASASNLLGDGQRPVSTAIPPPYQGECPYTIGVRQGYHPDLPAYPTHPAHEVSDYPHYTRESYNTDSPTRGYTPTRESYPTNRSSGANSDGFAPTSKYPTDNSLKTASMRDSGHMSGFPSYNSGFDDIHHPPMEHPQLHREPRDSSRGSTNPRDSHVSGEPRGEHEPRSQTDPLPPPPEYLLEEGEEPQEDRIYDEIYTIY